MQKNSYFDKNNSDLPLRAIHLKPQNLSYIHSQLVVVVAFVCSCDCVFLCLWQWSCFFGGPWYIVCLWLLQIIGPDPSRWDLPVRALSGWFCPLDLQPQDKPIREAVAQKKRRKYLHLPEEGGGSRTCPKLMEHFIITPLDYKLTKQEEKNCSYKMIFDPSDWYGVPVFGGAIKWVSWMPNIQEQGIFKTCFFKLASLSKAHLWLGPV